MKRLLLGCFQGRRQLSSRRETTVAPVEAVNSGPSPSRNSEQLLQATPRYDAPLPVVYTVTAPETDALPGPRQSIHVSDTSQPGTAAPTHATHHNADIPSTPRSPNPRPLQPEPCVPAAPPTLESPFTTPLPTNLLSGSTAHDNNLASDIVSLHSVISECSSDALLRVRGGAAALGLLDLAPTLAEPTAGPRQLASRVLRGRASLDALLLLGALVRAADEAGIAVSGTLPPTGPSRLERIESGDLPPTDELPGPQGGLGQGPQGNHVTQARQGQELQMSGGSGAQLGDVGHPVGHNVGRDVGQGEDSTGARALQLNGQKHMAEAPSQQPQPQRHFVGKGIGESPPRNLVAAPSAGSVSGSGGGPAAALTGGAPARDADFTLYPQNTSGGGGAAAVPQVSPWVGRGLALDSGILSVHQDPHRAGSNPYSVQLPAHEVGTMTADAQVLELLMRMVTNTAVDSKLVGSAQTSSGAHIFSTANAAIGVPPLPHERSLGGAATNTDRTSAEGVGDDKCGGPTIRVVGGGASQCHIAAHTPSADATTGAPGGHQRRNINISGTAAYVGGGPIGPAASSSSSSLYAETNSSSAMPTITGRGSAPLHSLHAGLVQGRRRNSCDTVHQTGPGALAMAAAAAIAAAGFLCSSNGGAHSSRLRSRCSGGSASRFWGLSGGGPGSLLSAGQEDSGPASLLLVGALSGLHSRQGGASLIRLPTGSGSIRDVLSRVQQQQQLEVGAGPSSSSWSAHTGLASLFDAPLTAALRHKEAVRTFKHAMGGGGLSLSQGSTGASQLTDFSINITGSLAAARNSSHLAGSSTAPTAAAATTANAGLSHLGVAAAANGCAPWLGGGLTRPPLRRATLSTVSSIRSNADAVPPAGAVPGRLTQPGTGSGTVRLMHMPMMPYCASSTGGDGGGPLGPPLGLRKPPLTYDQLRWIVERQSGPQKATPLMYGNDLAGGPSRPSFLGDRSATGLAAGPQHVSVDGSVPVTRPLMDLDERASTATQWHAEAHSARQARGDSATDTAMVLQTPYGTRRRRLRPTAPTDGLADALGGAGRDTAAPGAGSLGPSWLQPQSERRSPQTGPCAPRMAPAMVSELEDSSGFSRFSVETEWGPMGRGMEGDMFTLTSGRMSSPRGPGGDLVLETSDEVQ